MELKIGSKVKLNQNIKSATRGFTGLSNHELIGEQGEVIWLNDKNDVKVQFYNHRIRLTSYCDHLWVCKSELELISEVDQQEELPKFTLDYNGAFDMIALLIERNQKDLAKQFFLNLTKE